MKRPNKSIDTVLVNLLRKRILWILFGLALLGTLLLIAMPFGIEYGFKRYLLSQGADQADLADVDFNPFTRRLVVKNLIVKAGAEQVLNVSEAGLTLSWFPFFRKRFVLEKVDLSNSTITVEEMPDGRWRIGGLLPATSENKSTAPSWGFGLAALQIQNSRVKLRSAPLTAELKIEQARLTRLRSWLPDQKARLEFKGQINEGDLQFQGDFTTFGSATTVDGALKLQGLSLAPFAQLITADPGTLQGRLVSDVRIQTQYSSEKGFDFDQSGRLAITQAHLRFGDLQLVDENFTWDGSVQVKLPAASDILQIAVAGKLEGKGGFVNPTPDKLAFQHKGLGWNGKFVLDRKTQTADYTFDGALALQDFKMATPEMNLAEENLRWDGNVRIAVPESPDALNVTAAGKLAGKGASLDSPSANFKLQSSGLDWNGEFAFDAKGEAADVKLDGDLKFAGLEAATSDALMVEEGLKWNGGLQLVLPENAAAQRLTATGSLESRRQTIALLPEKLNLVNENLSWKGRFICGLQDVTAGLAAEGDLSLTDLAITATPKKLTLLASKAVNFKSIKGDAATQFSVATAKITGLDLVGQTGSPEKDSLFSASEVQVDSVKLERRKILSIESARIVAAKGVLHHKNDGRWRYIEDLAALMADSESSAQKNPSPNRAAEKAQGPAKEDDVEFGIRIGSLEIVGDSVVHYEDETVSPTFSTEVRLKEARVTDIDSQKPDQASPVSLVAESRKYTRLKLQGNVQPFGERISMDLKGKIKAVELPPLSSYAVKTLGYNLISGEMDADIDLKITVGKLQGEGDLKFYNPIVEAVEPEKMKSEGGRTIPLQSALKVLRDNDNDVRLKIPISGDVTDPEFSISDAINQALMKGLTIATLSSIKYMLGPYGVAIGIVELGAKFGPKALTGIRLKPVDFQPSASDLDPAAMEYLDKLAAILKEKKDLRLRLCGWATESDRTGPREAAAETPAAPSGAKTSGPDGQIVAPKDDHFPLSNAAILALAEQRANRIEDILVNQHGIEDKRIFICSPEIDEHPTAKPRVEIVF
jgi:outer membrane protein OmpA-like peptidoglycan-associated protein